jgi:hypothetical protein
VPREQHGLDDAGEGDSLTLEAEVVLAGQDDPIRVVDRSVELQQPARRIPGRLPREYRVLSAGIVPGLLKQDVVVGGGRLLHGERGEQLMGEGDMRTLDETADDLHERPAPSAQAPVQYDARVARIESEQSAPLRGPLGVAVRVGGEGSMI